MRVLRFIVDGQIIMADPGCDFSDLIPGSEGYLQAEFLFSPDWDGLTKTAVFSSALGRPYEPQLLTDGKTCIIPAEALKKRIFKVQVCGKNVDGSTIPTNKIIVAQTGSSVTTPSAPSTAVKLLTELYLETTFGPDSTYNANVINAVIQDILESKQDNLVSGLNIKTINGESIVGSGDLPVSGGGSDLNIVDVDNDVETLKHSDIYNAITVYNIMFELLGLIEDSVADVNEQLALKQDNMLVSEVGSTASQNTYPSTQAVYEYGQDILNSIRGDLDTVEALVGGAE